MIVFANAKINLGLNIVSKRDDGYHNLETVFYPVKYSDAIEIVERKINDGNKVKLFSSGVKVEGNTENNLIVKAYNILDEEFNLPPIDVYTIKNIPTGAGLGGGSADASFTIKLLNTYFSLSLSDEDMEIRAAKLGADCPFFIKNTPAYAEGIGDILEPINLNLDDYDIRIEKPNVFVSTKEAFSRVKPQKPTLSIKEILRKPISEWKDLLHNDFEDSVFPIHPEIEDLKKKFYEKGALYASMSGSGAAVYGIFEKEL